MAAEHRVVRDRVGCEQRRFDSGSHVRHVCQHMKTATIREAQHHLSKLVDEVIETGDGVVLTRRGVEVVTLLPIQPSSGRSSVLVNWNKAIKERNEALGDLPQLRRNPVLEMREEERY